MDSKWQLLTSVSQFFSFTENHRLCCVYVTAPWCFRCQLLWEKIRDLPAGVDFQDRVAFGKVDLQETEELGELLAIATLPTFLLFRGGAEVHRVEGVPQLRPARTVAQAVRSHLLASKGEGSGGGH